MKVIEMNCLLILLISLHGIIANPLLDLKDNKYVGQATNILTTKILKGTVDNEKNFVFSPFGVSTILAMLNEGAGDETRNDISNVLKFPNDRKLIRSSYSKFLDRLQGNDPHAAPQFRTWFYIYQNNSIEEEFKQVLENDYFVTAKEIERDYYNPEPNVSDRQTTTEENIPIVTDAQLLKTLEAGKNNSKDIIEFDELKAESDEGDETRIDDQQDASKFDEVVEDRQYVEVPAIKEEIEREKNEQENAVAGNVIDEIKSLPIPSVVPSTEKVIEIKKDEKTEMKTIDEPEKFTLPLKQFEDMEIMQAQESRLGKAFGGGNDGDGTSIISGNSIVGEKENAEENDKEKYESKMLLFNGLYYRGNWATPFQHLREANFESAFYPTSDVRVPVRLMRSCGYYSIGELTKLNSDAIEFPYDNERYSMLVIVPKKSEGLKQLIADLTASTLSDIASQLSYELIDISLPKFEIETTSGAEKVLAKEGLASLFTSKADLSGITRKQKLRVGELQQHVSFRVDEGSSSENFFTATNSLRSNAPIERTVVIDRPFLFFVRDRVDDAVIVAGKVVSLPKYENHEPEIPGSD